MLLLCAAGPKLFVTDTEQPRNEFVIWQEGGQLLLEPKTDAAPYATVPYTIEWLSSPCPLSRKRERRREGEWEGVMVALLPGSPELGRWTAWVEGDRVRMTMTVTNLTDTPWDAVVEAFVCYKHRGAPDYWDPELDRTYLGWRGTTARVRDRVEAIHGPGAFWPKNHLHHANFDDCFERYDRVRLRNPASAGWHSHRAVTDEGWMAIVRADGAGVSGIYWEGTQMLAQNGPDYGCLHAGVTLAPGGLAPGETATRRGVVRIGAISLDAFRQGYLDDQAAWSA